MDPLNLLTHWLFGLMLGRWVPLLIFVATFLIFYFLMSLFPVPTLLWRLIICAIGGFLITRARQASVK